MSMRFWLKLVPIAGAGLIIVNLVLLVIALPAGKVLPHGSKLAFMALIEQSWDIFVMDVSRELTARFTWNRDANERYPAWSPDGTEIAYHSDRTRQWEIYVTSQDGRETRQLTESAEMIEFDLSGMSRMVQGNAMADWSPDGTRIGFHSDLGGHWDLFTVAVDGSGDLQQVTADDGDEVLLDWSPDGKRIVYSAGVDWLMMLTVQDLETGEVTPLFSRDDLFLSDGRIATPTETLEDWSPSWSPDGTRIVFTSNRSGAADIYVLDIESGELTQLTDDFYRDYNPIWTDNNTLMFVSDRGGVGAGTRLFEMDADGKNLRLFMQMRYDIDAPAWYP